MRLIWPFPTRDPSQFRRIDQGWDLQVPVGTPILAVGSGKVVYGNDPSGFGSPYPVLMLDESVLGNPGVYYGHNHPEVGYGAHVNQGDVIAHALKTPGGNAHNLPGWLEIGWWHTGPTGNGQSMHDYLINAPIWTSAPTPTQNKDMIMSAARDDNDARATLIRLWFKEYLGRGFRAGTYPNGQAFTAQDEQALHTWVAATQSLDIALAHILDSPEAQAYKPYKP